MQSEGEGQVNSLHGLFAADGYRQLLLNRLRRYDTKNKLSLLRKQNKQGKHCLELSTPENLAAFFNAEDLWKDVAVELIPTKCSDNFHFLLDCIRLDLQIIRHEYYSYIKFAALLASYTMYASAMHQHLDFYKICLLMHLAPNISAKSHDRILDEQSYLKGKKLLL